MVGAGIQPLDALLDESSRGKHHDGRFDTTLAQFAAHFDPAYAREADIQKDGVVIHFPAKFEGFFAGVRDVDGVGIFSKSASNEARNFSFVFGQENAHKLMATIISR